MGSAPNAPREAVESNEARSSSSTQSASRSQVLPKIPGAARIPAEAMALAAAAEPRPSEARPSSETDADVDEPLSGVTERAPVPSLPPALARVGRYDVLGRIAVGGMAEIYLAREHVETGALRHVAIKVLKQSGSAQDGTYFEEMFLREGRTASQLVHPNICHVYDFGKWSGYFYIAMEWIEGSSLRTVLSKLAKRKKTMPPAIAVGIAAQVAGALHYAHTVRDARRRALQVVHLDVNPQNIMLRHDGVVKLLDFGIAQVADPRGDSRSDVVKGKVGYIAPEQALQQPLDRRVDVFGLGACLFEMLAGRSAYRRESMRESLEALLAQPVPSVREWAPEVPKELDEIVQKALAREPSERFQTAGELQAALEGYLARSREVVSGRHIAQLMESITPSAPTSPPALYTGPEVVSRLAPESELPLDDGIAVTRRGNTRRMKRAVVIAIGVLIGVLVAYFTASAPPTPSATVTPTPPKPAAIAPTAPPTAAIGATDVAPEGSAVPTAVPATPLKARAPAGARSKSDVPKGKRANRRRIKPSFVADPGF